MGTRDLQGQLLVDKLNDLVQLDYDAAVWYGHAIPRVDDATARHDLELLRGDHRRHLHELTGLVRELGAEPIDVHRDLVGVVLEGLTTVRSLAGRLAALRAIRTAERLACRAYRRASERAAPAAARVAIDQGFADERRHLAVIDAHIERLSGGRLAGVAVPAGGPPILGW